MNQTERKARLISIAATILIVAVIVLVLFFYGLTWDKTTHAEAGNPVLEQEELYLDPELMHLGEEDAVKNDLPSAAPLGEPEESNEPKEELVVKGDNPKPAVVEEKKISTPKESRVKTQEPPATDKEESRISSSMKGKFASNGKKEGKAESNGSGGAGVGTKGSLKGRVFEGCPAPSLKVSKEVTIVVSVTVNAEGKVTEASFSRDSGPGQGNMTLRKACVNASRKARFSAKKGAVPARGTITWHLRPRS